MANVWQILWSFHCAAFSIIAGMLQGEKKGRMGTKREVEKKEQNRQTEKQNKKTTVQCANKVKLNHVHTKCHSHSPSPLAVFFFFFFGHTLSPTPTPTLSISISVSVCVSLSALSGGNMTISYQSNNRNTYKWHSKYPGERCYPHNMAAWQPFWYQGLNRPPPTASDCLWGCLLCGQVTMARPISKKCEHLHHNGTCSWFYSEAGVAQRRFPSSISRIEPPLAALRLAFN